MCTRFIKRLIRRKHLTAADIEKTDLARCLTTLDLTALGIGSTLGAGAYVIAGTVARDSAGPAVVVSFLIAAVASILAGICYAEFGARVPKAGSAYVYTYVAVGEFVAFIIGWNLILEYVIGSASVARTFSGYFDDLIGDQLIPWFNATLPMHVPTLAPYIDLMALAITSFVTLLLAFGVKESATFTKVFTGLNLVVLTYIIISGAFKDKPHNWFLDKDEVPDPVAAHCASLSKQGLHSSPRCCGHATGCGSGGFAPYGFSGIISGAATCFFAFVGFDVIATTGEEAENPQKSIPISIIVSLLIIFVMYFGISLTLTMMVPYFALDSKAPFAKIFQNSGWMVSKYIISVGAICALCTSLLGAMFPMPRVVLAMGRDGVIFRIFGRVSSRFKTPIIATVVTGALAGVMAALFDIKSLVNMMSIGTLLAYTLVAACVLLLRYEEDDEETLNLNVTSASKTWYGGPQGAGGKLMASLKPSSHSSIATPFSAQLVKILTFIMALAMISSGSVLTFAYSELFIEHKWWAIAGSAVSLFVTLFCCFLICMQHQNKKKLNFTTPLVPIFPAASMFFNIYLMLNLDHLTWARFGVWMLIGLVIYFSYGIWHSSEETGVNMPLADQAASKFDGTSSQAALVDDTPQTRAENNRPPKRLMAASSPTASI